MSLFLNNYLEAWTIDFYAMDRPPEGLLTLLVALRPEILRQAAIIWAMLQDPALLTTTIPTPDLSFLDAEAEEK